MTSLLVFIGSSGFLRRKGRRSRKLFWQFRQEMEEVWTKVETADILRSESLYVFQKKEAHNLLIFKRSDFYFASLAAASYSPLLAYILFSL